MAMKDRMIPREWIKQSKNSHGKRIGRAPVWSFSRRLEEQSHLIESPFTETLA